jgi:hypothetical protein
VSCRNQRRLRTEYLPQIPPEVGDGSENRGIVTGVDDDRYACAELYRRGGKARLPFGVASGAEEAEERGCGTKQPRG